MAKKIIEVWTDGACRGNGTEASVGGIGIVLVCGEHYKEIKKAQFGTTNNAQELSAAIEGLKAIKDYTAKITLYSDSAYLVNCIEAKWYKKWRINGWKTSKNEPVKNVSLWNELLKLVESCSDIRFVHVKGHSNIGHNERCDALANEAIEELIANATFSH